MAKKTHWKDFLIENDETKAERKARLTAVKDLPKKLKEMETRTVVFDSADMCEAWLEWNKNNRPVKAGTVKRFVNYLETGEFRTTSQGISISKKRWLQDGQKRLIAGYLYFMNSEDAQPFEMRVTEGEDDHFEFFDQGDNRSTADVFSVEKKDYPVELAHATRLLWIRYNGSRVAGAGKTSPYALSEFLKDFKGLEDSVKFVMEFGSDPEDEDSIPCKETMSPGYAAALHYLMSHADNVVDANKKADEFWTLVINQEAKKGTTPYMLYRKLLKVKATKELKMDRDALVDNCIYAFNVWVDGGKNPDGKKVTTLRLPSDRPELGGYDGAGVVTKTDEEELEN